MDHPDFRVCGEIFATLGYPDDGCAVKLTPLQQYQFVQAEPAVFTPVKGAWGRRGATSVRLKSAKKPSLRRARAPPRPIPRESLTTPPASCSSPPSLTAPRRLVQL